LETMQLSIHFRPNFVWPSDLVKMARAAE